MSKGFIMLYREGGLELLEEDPKAFLLYTQIALRAQRSTKNYSRIPLKSNQSLIGDPQKIGLSQQEYKGAKKRLKKYGLATFLPTPQGTIATLTSTEVYNINADSKPDSEEPSIFSMQNSKNEPPENHPTTISDSADTQQKSTEEPLTRMQELKKCKKTTTPQVAAEATIYECLQNQPTLSDQEKSGLMVYPEDRVLKSIAWASTSKIKTSLTQALHWHCKQEIPPPPLDKASHQTEQQQEAWQYNQFLKDYGFEVLFIKNQEAIPQFHVHLILNGVPITSSLKNSIEIVRSDLKDSMNYILKNKGVKT
jgi:hypothetical protein